MKLIIKTVALLLAVLFIMSGCVKKNDGGGETTTDGESTSEKTVETTVPEKEETTKADPDTSSSDTVDDGEVHVTELNLDKYKVTLTVGKSDMPMVTMLPQNAENKNEIWKSDNTSVATVNRYGNITGVGEGKCTVTVTSEDNPNVKQTVEVTVNASKGDTGLTYIKGILVVNKTYSLPSDYNPGISTEAQTALNKMIAAAANDDISLWIASGFRSYDRQYTLYNNYVARDGKAAADRYSARPGHSEHQTGLAFDLNSLEQSFGETPEGKWIAANSWKYGFILRYPQNKEAQTGYMYEPWHVRYLGEENAKSVYESGLCLEEYLGITSVYAN